MIKSGISQIGGKFRLYKELLKRTPYHEFFLSPFCGACYDSETEILIKNKGWILFKELELSDQVACLSKKQEFYWHKPSQIQKYFYEGEMVKIQHRSVDLLITPDHNLYVRRKSQKQYELIQAKNSFKECYTINKTEWVGREKEWFYPPKINYLREDYNIEKIKMDLWLRFLGWYISEGSYINEKYSQKRKEYRISIGQSKKQNLLEIKEILEEIGVKYIYNEKNFSFTHKQLYYYLKKLGRSFEKYIPLEYMNLSRRQLEILYVTLMKGDGDKKGRFYTTSKKLADQVHEIIIKLGFNATLNSRNRIGERHYQEDHYIENKRISFNINKRMAKECRIRPFHFSKKKYKGFVYCCTVPDHIILIRRNGRSVWCGNCWYELNKPRCRYECFNDLNSELINYFIQIRKHPKEFDEMKQGIFGLVSQEICNRIVKGDITPKNDLERAYFYYYLNKLTFGGGIWMVREKPPYKGIDPADQAGRFEMETKGFAGLIDQRRQRARIDAPGIEDAKMQYKYKTKGYAGLNQNRAIPQTTFHKKDIDSIKASFKGINPKTTRPFTNNDLGLLSPLDPECIKRLRYVNLTSYDFRRVYDLFYKAFYKRKGLDVECLLYFDPPYPGTEKYYKSGFGEKEHLDLIKILLESPFHCMLSIGGECDLYLDALRKEGWIIDPVTTKYSTDANSQKDSQEYICMNYDINQLPLMIDSIEQKLIINY